MKILKYFIVAFALALGMSSIAQAAPTPPPVNQNMGIPDSSFEDFDASLCKSCHHAIQEGDTPLSGAPVNAGYNPSRHHLAIGTPIDGKPEFPPFRDGDGDGVNDTTFTCYSCHLIKENVVTGETELESVILFNYRNCMNCHERQKGPLTVHHATDRAQQGNCFQCHGGIVRGIDVATGQGKKPHPTNPGETVPVALPDYQPSMITPWRSKKPNGDASQVNHAGTEPGNCNFCHNSSSGNTDDPANEPLTLPDGSIINVKVYTNMENHHNTGFFNDNKCAWCHVIEGDMTNGSGFETSAQAIRVCQRCHDRSTLHNIEFDAVGDGVTPGGEEPYFGHIGNANNCWGCHGNDKTVQNEAGEWVDPRTNPELTNQNLITVDNNDQLRNSVSGALVPIVTTLSPRNVANGSEALMTLTGQSFVNSKLIRQIATNPDGSAVFDENNNVVYEESSHTYTSQVILTDKNNNVTVIEPISQDSTTIEFLFPGNLDVGHYDVSLKKAYQTSNPLGISVLPTIKVDQGFVYTPYGSLVALIGKDFNNPGGLSVNGKNGFNLVDQNGNAPTALYLWQDDLIVAYFAEDPVSVTVTNLFGTKVIPLNRY